MNFWTLAFSLLFFIVYLGMNGLIRNMGIDLKLHFAPPMLTAVFIGLSYGFLIGNTYYLLANRLFKNRALWKGILFQVSLSAIILLILTFIARTILFEQLVRYFIGDANIYRSNEGWVFFITVVFVYTMTMTILMGFINQMNKKFGPGILIPMLFGRFRNPREEERVFMFLDLNNSTTIAEELGHISYSAFVRDCFQDINDIVQKYYAEIYQYVGDEIIISWPAPEGIKSPVALDFFFSCVRRFGNRKSYYKNQYAIEPEFKAGVHFGKVTSVEVGDIKRDIAYHGDTLNVASRIENMCKEFKENILVSKDYIESLHETGDYLFTSFGHKEIRGRKTQLEIFKVLLT